jgi:hypothetical protein
MMKNYRKRRLRLLNEDLIPQALEYTGLHDGERAYKYKLLKLIEERDQLEKGNIRGLLSRLRNSDRFAIVYPLLLSTTLLSGCSTYQNKELWRDIRDGYTHQVAYGQQTKPYQDMIQLRQDGKFISSSAKDKTADIILQYNSDYIRGGR